MKPAARTRELRLADLVLFNVAATLGPQLIPAFAHVGPIAIPLHLLAATLFFVPCALLVASLSHRFPGEGGLYLWTRNAFGEWHGFLCAWSYWISVLLFLPSLVLIAVGMATEAMGASGAGLVDSGPWQIGLGVLVLWLTVAANLLGLRVSKWLSNVGGTLLYLGVCIVVLAGIATGLRFGSATRFHFDPAITFQRVSLWAQIAFAYTGLELGSILGGDIRDPRRTIPRAVWISAAAIAFGYLCGSLALMLVVAPGEINPITGLTQVAQRAGARLHIPSLGAWTACFFCAGILGKLSNWNTGAARLVSAVGLDGVLSKSFTPTPRMALLVQGIACSAFLILTNAGETVRGGWQVLMDMEILAAFLPYIYIFLASWKFGQPWSGASGLAVTLAAMGFSLVPPENARSVPLFEAKVIGGVALLVLGGWLIFVSARRNSRETSR